MPYGLTRRFMLAERKDKISNDSASRGTSATAVQWSNYLKVFRDPYGERGAQAYNGGLGQSLN